MNRVPEPVTIASGFINMVDLGGTNFQNVQGCTAVSGGTGLATITLGQLFPVEELEILAFPLSAPSAGVTLNSGNPGPNGVFTITARQASDQALLNVPFTFSVRHRGKLR